MTKKTMGWRLVQAVAATAAPVALALRAAGTCTIGFAQYHSGSYDQWTVGRPGFSTGAA